MTESQTKHGDQVQCGAEYSSGSVSERPDDARGRVETEATAKGSALNNNQDPPSIPMGHVETAEDQGDTVVVEAEVGEKRARPAGEGAETSSAGTDELKGSEEGTAEKEPKKQKLDETDTAGAKEVGEGKPEGETVGEPAAPAAKGAKGGRGRGGKAAKAASTTKRTRTSSRATAKKSTGAAGAAPAAAAEGVSEDAGKGVENVSVQIPVEGGTQTGEVEVGGNPVSQN